MLDHLRQQVTQALAATHSVTLSTYGPAGIQAGVFSCQAAETRLYLLIPLTSDQLFNLEHETAVVLTTPEWQLQGEAHILNHMPAHLTQTADSHWYKVVEIAPTRLHLHPHNGRTTPETIDL